MGGNGNTDGVPGMAVPRLCGEEFLYWFSRRRLSREKKTWQRAVVPPCGATALCGLRDKSVFTFEKGENARRRHSAARPKVSGKTAFFSAKRQAVWGLKRAAFQTEIALEAVDAEICMAGGLLSSVFRGTVKEGKRLCFRAVISIRIKRVWGKEGGV